jgi:hypothetical protein
VFLVLVLQDTIYKDTICKGTIYKGIIYKDTIYKGTIYKGKIYKDIVQFLLGSSPASVCYWPVFLVLVHQCRQ